MNEEEQALSAEELYEQVEAEKEPGFFERLANTFNEATNVKAASEAMIDTELEPGEVSPEYQAVRENLEEGGPEPGLVTKYGEKVLDVKDAYYDIPAAAADKINEMVPEGNPLKGVTQFADDRILSADERRSKIEENIQTMRDEENPLRYLVETAYGAETGLEAGVMLPVTVAAAITNQSSDAWSDPPEILKGSPLGSLAFEITQLLPVSVLTAGFGGGAGLGIRGTAGVLATESLVETATQDSLDEVIFGPEIAGKFAELVTQLTGDPEQGKAVAEELARGDSVASQAFLKSIGFLQNLGFNVTAEAVRATIAGRPIPTPEESKAAKALGKEPEEVAESVNTTVPKDSGANPDMEPNEGSTKDNTVPVSESKSGINEDSLVSELLRSPDGVVDPIEIRILGNDRVKGKRYKVLPDELEMVDQNLSSPARKFFNKLEAWSSNQEALKGLELASQTLERLNLTKRDLAKIRNRAVRFLFENQYLMSTDMQKFLRNFKNQMTQDIPVEQRDVMYGRANPKVLEEALLNQRMVTNPGMVAGLILADEAGQRIQKTSQAISNMRQANIDASELEASLDNLIDFAQVIMMPIVQRKGDFAVSGMSQQRTQVKAAMEYRSALEAAMESGGYNDIEKVLKDATLGDLIASGGFGRLRQGVGQGNPAAKQLMEQLINQLAYADSRTLLTDLKIYGDSLDEAFKRSWTDGLGGLYYSFMLSRATTQAAAAFGTGLRYALQPLSMISKSQFMKIAGMKGAAERYAHGLGTWAGIAKGTDDSMEIFLKAWRQNSPINGGDRVRVQGNLENIETDRARDAMIWEAKKRRMAQEGADPAEVMVATMTHWIGQLYRNPFVNWGPRTLMAQDEVGKVLQANATAYAAGYVKTAAEGGRVNFDDMSEVINEQLRQVFVKGAKDGVINPEADLGQAALDIAKYNAFQRTIPHGDMEGAKNQFNKAFYWFYETAENVWAFKWFAPWMRMGWDSLEQGVTNMPVVGELSRTKFFNDQRNRIFREGSAPNATPAQKARMYEVESNMALGYMTTALAAGLAAQGMIYGKTTAPTPELQNKFVVPIPGQDELFAFDYSKLMPMSLWVSQMADLVGAFKYGGISRQEYHIGMTEIISSVAVNTLDQNFNSGLNSFSEMLNYKNWNPATMTSMAANLTAGFFPAALRGVGAIVSPEEQLMSDMSIPGNLGRVLDRRLTGGTTIGTTGNTAANINPINGETKFKTWVPRGTPNEVGFARVMGAIGEIMPGNTTNAVSPDHPTIKVMTKLGYKLDSARTRQVYGVPLTVDEQSILRQEMNSVGSLNYVVAEWWKENEQEWKDIQKAVKNDGKLFSLSRNTVVNQRWQQFKSKFSNVIEQVKMDTVNRGSLRNGTLPDRIREQEQRFQEEQNLSMGAEPVGEGLYKAAALAAGKDTLPDEVQTILDIA